MRCKVEREVFVVKRDRAVGFRISCGAVCSSSFGPRLVDRKDMQLGPSTVSIAVSRIIRIPGLVSCKTASSEAYEG